jgi:uncharacterized membrane protein YkvA (DUF1232 family)
MKKSSKQIDGKYIHENAAHVDSKDMETILNNEDTLKTKWSKLGKMKIKIKTLFQMLKDYKNKRYTETPWKSVAAIIFALLYVLNPLDLAPDFIPIIGYIDDATVLAFTLKLIEGDVEKYELWRKNQTPLANE